uniref:Uncharacterized protein n=1 Tax=Timema tahoe TaxID=61484 RepID=A0A7R9IN77_9NEOP|nr:unnamed protein product [Timema tahoe]
MCSQLTGWGESNSNYLITNEKKLASKTSPEQSVLLSSTAQFGPGHSIEFTVLECGIGCSDEGLGLVAGPVEGENLIQPGCLFVNTQGTPLSKVELVMPHCSSALAPTTPSTAWAAPHFMFSEPSVTISPLYSTPKRTPLSIGSLGGHCPSGSRAPMRTPTFSHWARPGSSGGYLTRWFLAQRSIGSVFVDGAEKTTKLPSLQKCSKVCFTCENIRDGKIRVNVDSNNKTVTYDWSVRCPLYFAVCFALPPPEDAFLRFFLLTRPGRPPPNGDLREKSMCFWESSRTTKLGIFTTCFLTLNITTRSR